MAEALKFVKPGEVDKFCETPTALRILNLLSRCHEKREIGVIVGLPGVGKTYAINRYAHHHPEVYVCTMSPANSSPSAALALV